MVGQLFYLCIVTSLLNLYLRKVGFLLLGFVAFLSNLSIFIKILTYKNLCESIREDRDWTTSYSLQRSEHLCYKIKGDLRIRLFKMSLVFFLITLKRNLNTSNIIKKQELPWVGKELKWISKLPKARKLSPAVPVSSLSKPKWHLLCIVEHWDSFEVHKDNKVTFIWFREICSCKYFF